MIRHHVRGFLVAVLVISVALGASAATAADDEEPSITFFGGGLGHGIGLSQYGAYGRAMAGHSYTEILAHYYADTTIQPADGYGDFSDIDVLIDVRSGLAVSPPSGTSGWETAISAGGPPIATSATPVTLAYTEGQWSALVDSDGAGGEEPLDVCYGLCGGGALTLSVPDTSYVVLEEVEDGPNVGNPVGGQNGAFARGRIVLHPGALGGGCGGGDEFCVIHADLAIDDYLYGIAEIPCGWPAAAQQAQAVAARSYAASAVTRRAGNVFDLYASTQDQYYAGYFKEAGCENWRLAVDATANKLVIHESTIAETFYSASNGGHSAEPPEVWASGSARPYLQATPDEYDGNEANPYAAREYVYTLSDVNRWFNESEDEDLHVGSIRSLEIDGPDSGRVSFATVTIIGTENAAEVMGGVVYSALRSGCLADGESCDALRSTNFSVLSVLSFIDVGFTDYFYVPVQWMTVETLTQGIAPDTFGSHDSNTRAQLATFLWRFAGEPDPAAPSTFNDVVADSYYELAVAWLKETGITTGTSPSKFSPDGTVTRAQAAAFLWRFAGSPSSEAEHSFTDVGERRFFTEAVRWMAEWGLTTGTTETTFSPDEELTRAQIATFLWRLAGTPEAFAEGVDLPPAMRVA